MQRHRDQQASLERRDQRRHVARHGPRDRDLAAIFEADGEASRQVRHKRPAARVRAIRGGLARQRAQLVCLRRLERKPAASTARNRPGIRSAASNRRRNCARRATIVPQPAQRGGSAKSSAQRSSRAKRRRRSIALLSPDCGASHKRPMSQWPDLFDMKLRAMRRDRAARIGRRAVPRSSALSQDLPRTDRADPAPIRARASHRLPRSGVAERLRRSRSSGCGRSRSTLFAEAAGGEPVIEDAWQPAAAVLTTWSSPSARSTPSTTCRSRCGLIRGAMRAGRACSSARCPAAIPCRSFAPRCARPTRSRAPRRRTSIRGSRRRRSPRSSIAAGFAAPVVDVDRVEVSLSLAWARWSATCAPWARTNILTERAAQAAIEQQRLPRPREHFARAGDGERTDRDVRDPAFRRVDARQADDARVNSKRE